MPLFLWFDALFIGRESNYSFEILRELLHDPQKMVLNYQGTTNELLTINTASEMREKIEPRYSNSQKKRKIVRHSR